MSIDDDIARAQQMVGRELADKFRLTACIGLGGTGAVYRAEQMALGRSVAVKILKDELADDERLGRRFRDEAMAASRLNHPNIVSIIDYGQTPEGRLYLAMEYLRGPTLTQLIVREQPLAPLIVLDIVSQILLGMEEAHLAGVVHADLKSDNIIIDQRRAGTDVVKIVDFGIARMVNATETGDDRVTGTPEYMAPEVIGGNLPGFPADIYAVGIMLYELLVGHTPFVGGSTVEILTRQLKGEAAPVSSIRTDLPSAAEFDAICRRSLAKQPGDRYSSASEMRTAILALAARIRGVAPVANLVCGTCGEQCMPAFRFCPSCATPRSPTSSRPEEATGIQSRQTIDLGLLQSMPLHGRATLQASLRAHLARAGTGVSGPRALLVVGGTGSGRTRLVHDTGAAMGDAGHLILYKTAADPSGLATTYYPIRAVLAAVLGLPPLCDDAEFRAQILELGLGEPDVSGIAEIFGQLSPLASLEPEIRRHEMATAAMRVLEAATARGPIAIMFDDVDRYDDPSLSLLRHFSEAGPSLPPIVLIVDEAGANAWPATVPRLEVAPLDDHAVAAMVQDMIDGPSSDAEAAALTFGQGVPGYVDHLLRYLLDGGQLEDSRPALADLIAARLSMLSQATLGLCQAAAVFGTEVELENLRVTSLVVDVDAALTDAISHGFLQVDLGVVRFASQLVREVVYDATPAHVRRALHGAAAEALEQSGGGEFKVLGHHHDLAGHATQAIGLLIAAGDQADHQLDGRGAAALYHRGQVAVREALRAGADQDDVHLASDFVGVSVKLANVLRGSGDIGLARGVLAEARDWADGPVLQARLDQALARVAESETDYPAAISLLRRAIGGAISGGNLTLVVDIYCELSSALIESGDRNGAASELAECLDIVTFGEGALAEFGPPNLWQLLKRQAMLRAVRGDFEIALNAGEAALAQAQRAGIQAGIVKVSILLVQLAINVGNEALANTYRQLAVSEMRALGDTRPTLELISAVGLASFA